MKSKLEFIKLVDNRFFNHLNTKSLIPFEVKSKRTEFLGTVYDKLLRNFTTYKPSLPRKYISIPKNKYVIRMVPSFQLDDYCIYYFCIKVLEEYIAENRVIGTFGGFRLGGKLRDKENLEFEPSVQDSWNENSFNAFAWKQEYGEYQSKLCELSLRMGDEFKFAVQFDIANFYDCIRIDLLEAKIRKRVVTDDCDDEIYILIQFLKYWNRRFDPCKSVGIPQDEVGDCSRILSNFYLQNYDQFMYEECLLKKSSYLRYADDQIIFTKSKEDAEELMYKASQKLFEEGLNINTSKTKEFTNSQEFDDVYGFSIFEKLKINDQDINQAFEMFLDKKNLHHNFRESSVLRRMLNDKIKIDNLFNQNRIRFISYLWDENFLLFSDCHYMIQIYKMLKDDGEKTEFLDTLGAINIKTNFESYKINYQKFMRTLIY